ncbi:limonene-1,2-epoxide hydrolase [Frankia torreyi]|uniref:Limonene-1,2-epoxide hydrolase n=1 Tax=Frankia torreyi TaxID=1856 RepID=A0A0D8BEH8_9ACTN|nr:MULTISPECIES: limonene-1,2-epoxide hydrolase family protein [Frankia]KJE21787.1 limonene-1,2-epoxide hydrolase [Frankia torreyi]KQC38223.1 limonene-1,2-epoxide hydrolase [Frankia sp. ACN1ag]KQM03928.1 limonene-1,2-epoxide hydrolase [Frankia sp. CpI1-P]
MSDKHELLVRQFLDRLVERDYDAAAALVATTARYHVSAWQPAVVGRPAIRAEFDRQAALYSAFQYELVTVASTDSVVFTERLDSLTMGGRSVVLHWCGVFTFDADGLISVIRDYYDIKELEQALAPA